MPTTCPKCGKQFKGNAIGAHAMHCDVTPSELFWDKVDKSAGPDACWTWTGAVTTHGYGCFKFTTGRNGRVLGAHKIAYLLTKGEVPDGLQIRHACDNRLCCNPAHLSVGTGKDNARDKVERGRCQKTNKRKLDLEKARYIKEARGKETSGELAAKFNIQQSHVFGIWSGRIWREA